MRGSNWTHEETLLLAELKLNSLEDASLIKKDGPTLWNAIATKISGRDAAQCQRRWDNLVKDYKSIEKHCESTGKNYRSLNDKDLSSIKLATAYDPAWYGVVKSFCDRTARKRTKAAVRSTSEQVPNPLDVSRDSFVPLTPGPTSDRNSEFEKLSLEEENLKLERENNALRLTQQDQLSAEEKNQNLKKEKAFLLTQMQPPQASQQHEIEYAESEPARSGLSDECPNDAQCNGAETEAEVMVYDSLTKTFDFEDYKPLSPFAENCDLSWFMSNMSLSKAETLAEDSASTVSEGTITRESSDNSILEALDTKSECVDLKAASKVIELGVRLCCTGCKNRLKKKISKVDGIQKLEFRFDCHRVIVTAKAEPEVVLKHAQMAKKEVVLLSSKKLIAPKS